MRKQLRWLAIAGVLALAGAACGSDDGDGGGDGGDGGGDTITPATTYDTIGEGEGALELIAWAGLHRGRDDRGIRDLDWVTPFEDEIGCDVNVTYADSSDEMVTLMRQSDGSVYDGVSASGDASNRLIAGQGCGRDRPGAVPGDGGRDRAAATRRRDEQCALRRRRQRVRHAVHVRAELPDVQHRGREPGSDELGRHVRGRLAVRRVDHRLRLADLHRRRGDVPDVDATRTSGSPIRTSSIRRSSTRRWIC